MSVNKTEPNYYDGRDVSKLNIQLNDNQTVSKPQTGTLLKFPVFPNLNMKN
ncbi:MAG: hypothetical protein LPK26_01900 [Bacillaceae bacterium]|uniref:Uncharacterized protein n=1 Tax=Alkalihalobacterium chitinilyticum TaxID=2980103 RepID=A0ABT5VDU7_9BACI|nr:hypothetical protein [Alkalihalobacterium chitinilyticum]MDE5413635.1 hypothetical protein [Alkalihalobacterium chitinilyticum]MEB1806049.1 hypothetical protein [Bacillaceae bacterium]